MPKRNPKAVPGTIGPTPLAAVLQDWLSRKGWSQRELARQAGVDPGDVNRLLAGKRTTIELGTAKKLADALGCSIEQLTGDEPPAPAAPDTGLRLLALDQLVASPANPRRTFDNLELTQLAGSIASDGLLQNLVVRQTGEVFEVIAGERRLRALLQLAGEGRWSHADATVPCRVVAADDVAARAIALLENLQRAELPPLEEARALLALHELDTRAWSTLAIAERIGRTQRYVQQRLALVRLEPRVQQALAAGKIKIEAARALAGAEPKQQVELLNRMLDSGGSYMQDPERIRDELTRNGRDAALAIFNLALYRGNRLETDDGKTWLLDKEEFDRLQKSAAEDRVERLKSQWGWAKLVEGWFRENDFIVDEAAKKKAAGVVVNIDCQGRVTEYTGLVKREKEESDDSDDDGEPEVDFAARRESEQEAERATLRQLQGALALAPPSLLLKAQLIAEIALSGGDSIPESDHIRALIGLPPRAPDDWNQDYEAVAGAAGKLLDLSDLDLVVYAAATVCGGLRSAPRSPEVRALLERFGIALPAHLQAEPADEDPEAEAAIDEVETDDAAA